MDQTMITQMHQMLGTLGVSPLQISNLSTYNIKTYGGTGNGVANDDAALTATLAKISAGGNLILF